MTAITAPRLDAGERITFLLADDHALVRDGLKLLVWAARPAVRFVESADAIALMKAAQAAPEARLALVDLNMPGMGNGIGLAGICRAFPQLPLVVVSGLTSPDVIRSALGISSVHAFVPKSATPEHLHLAIDTALRGIKLHFAPAPEPRPARGGFTPRMEEVHVLLRQGMTNRAIASQLSISEGSVKNYVTEIFRILKVSNRTQAARHAAWQDDALS